MSQFYIVQWLIEKEKQVPLRQNIDADGDRQKLPLYFHRNRARLKSALKTFFSTTNCVGSATMVRAARYLWHPQTKSGAKLFIILEESLRGGISKGAGGGRTIQTDWIGRFFPTLLHSRILLA